jgi:hypothetical protein
MSLKKMGVRANVPGLAGLLLAFMAGLDLVAVQPVTVPGSIAVR